MGLYGEIALIARSALMQVVFGSELTKVRTPTVRRQPQQLDVGHRDTIR
jgi:hypothetical protein